jgi:hypothetical protein
MRPKPPQSGERLESSNRTNSEPSKSLPNQSNSPASKIPASQPAGAPGQQIPKVSPADPARPGAMRFDRDRAILVLDKIDELLAAEQKAERERDARFVQLGQYLCEVREGQYWRIDDLKSFDEFLEKRFPESRRKAYYLMTIYEELPRQIHRELPEVGWAKATDLAKIARREGQRFDCATWLPKAKQMAKEQFKRAVEKHLTGKETEVSEIIYFKVYKSQLAVIEQALEAASAVLSGRKSRGACLDFICANFVENIRNETLNPGMLSNLIRRFFERLPVAERRGLLEALGKSA